MPETPKQREWEAKNKENRKKYNRKWRMKRDYGVTQEQFELMLAATGGRCPICGRTFGSGKIQGPQIDHDHKTGKIRGLLCRYCNNGIGFFNDVPERLILAAEYLSRFN